MGDRLGIMMVDAAVAWPRQRYLRLLADSWLTIGVGPTSYDAEDLPVAITILPAPGSGTAFARWD